MHSLSVELTETLTKLTLRYYLRHCWWGLFGCGFLVYSILTSLYGGTVYPDYVPYIPYVAAYLTVGGLTYPYTYYAVEKLFLKIMSEKTWEKVFGDTCYRNLFLFIYMLCILLTLPLLILYFLLPKPVKTRKIIKNKSAKKRSK